jgi:hypothetical protein
MYSVRHCRRNHRERGEANVGVVPDATPAVEERGAEEIMASP